MKQVGLRIDVDISHGTRDGIPRLLGLLGQHGTQASFFSNVEPDDMGRYLWHLVKSKFPWKMLRSKAASSYGWDTPLADTAWPGRRISAGNKAVIHAAAESHEAGLYTQDHYSWQAWSSVWLQERPMLEVECGLFELERIISRLVACSVIVGWHANQRVIKVKESFDSLYDSGCRGTWPFLPQLGSGTFGTVQIPVTLSTWNGAVDTAVDTVGFSRYLLGRTHRDPGVSAHTVYAEVGGITYADQFNELLTMAAEEKIQPCPLSQLLPADSSELPSGKVVRGGLAGREGWLGREQLLTSGV